MGVIVRFMLLSYPCASASHVGSAWVHQPAVFVQQQQQLAAEMRHCLQQPIELNVCYWCLRCCMTILAGPLTYRQLFAVTFAASALGSLVLSLLFRHRHWTLRLQKAEGILY